MRVPIDEVTVNVQLGRGGAPAMLVRAGTERDYDAICAMHAARSAAAAFALRRDPQALHYALAKKRLFAGLSAPGTHQVEFFVAEEGASAAAYVVLSKNQHGWTLEEAGDRDPAGDRLGGMLQVLAAREPSQPMPLIRAWWPRLFPGSVTALTFAALRPEGHLHGPASQRRDPAARHEDVFYWRSDYF